MTIPISEIFGPTIQGEGLDIGRLATFIRVAGCDLNCQWCDTKYAWDADAAEQLEVEEIYDRALSLKPNPGVVVLTGGNPCLYDLEALVNRLHRSFYVHVETQGTLWPRWLNDVDVINLSPKPPSSGCCMEPKDVQRARSDSYAIPAAIRLKLVFNPGYEDDREWALRWLKSPNYIKPIVLQTVRIPHVTYEAMLVQMFQFARDRLTTEILSKVRVLPQLHQIMWPDRRGV